MCQWHRYDWTIGAALAFCAVWVNFENWHLGANPITLTVPSANKPKFSCLITMPYSIQIHRRDVGRTMLALCAPIVLMGLPGCATMNQRDALKVNVVGVEPLLAEGLELRLLVKMRVQNPNDSVVEFDGMALEMELNGKSLASGVSDKKGVVPRFGELLVEVPLTVSAFAAVRQALALSSGADKGEMPYVVTGKLAGGQFGTVRFSSGGTFKLPM